MGMTAAFHHFPSGLTSLRSRCASVCDFSAKAFTPYRSRPDERADQVRNDVTSWPAVPRPVDSRLRGNDGEDAGNDGME